ncbi:MAG: hypothetical protein ACLU4B_01830 [Bilophila wadsworthia]
MTTDQVRAASNVRVAHLSDINALFTDGPIDKKWADLIHEHGVELFMV